MATSTDATNRIGINAVALIFEKMDWIFREQPTSDYGIDAQAEKRGPDGKGTGKLIALQIKTGKSHFVERAGEYVFYGEERHQTYWTNHSLPVFIVLHDPDTDTTLWQRVAAHLIEEKSNGRWAIEIPRANTLDAAHESYILAGIPSDEASIRRNRLTLDLPLIERFSESEETYLRIEEWVNKSLNFRDTEIIFGENPEGVADLVVNTWLPAYELSAFMARMFPWLDYKVVSFDEDQGAGELAIHTLEVELSDLGKAALLLEEFYLEGAPEKEVTGDVVSQQWLDSIDDVGDLD